MSGLFIPLRLTPGVAGVYLRGLRGADELAVEGTDTKTLLYLLDSLMKEGPGENNIRAPQIVTSDRDRLLAALYISLYGSKVESTLSCRDCQQKFDLDFSLENLLMHYQPAPAPAVENGIYEPEPGICFRLPTGEDELAVSLFSKEEAAQRLLEKCLLKGDPETAGELVQEKMAELAPVLNLEMQAVCPECNHNQQVQFDIQTFFLQKLIHERPLLMQEIHGIASQYHWSQQEILDLPRDRRKQFAALILEK